MSVARTLATNLQALIDADPGLSEHSLSTRSGVPKSTIRRMRLEEGDARIDNVESVANAFRLRACDLLDPGLANRVRERQPLRMAEPRPPVVSEEAWRQLSPRARAFIEDVCQKAASGVLDDSNIGWLHEALQRLGPK